MGTPTYKRLWGLEIYMILNKKSARWLLKHAKINGLGYATDILNTNFLKV